MRVEGKNGERLGGHDSKARTEIGGTNFEHVLFYRTSKGRRLSRCHGRGKSNEPTFPNCAKGGAPVKPFRPSKIGHPAYARDDNTVEPSNSRRDSSPADRRRCANYARRGGLRMTTGCRAEAPSRSQGKPALRTNLKHKQKGCRAKAPLRDSGQAGATSKAKSRVLAARASGQA